MSTTQLPPEGPEAGRESRHENVQEPAQDSAPSHGPRVDVRDRARHLDMLRRSRRDRRIAGVAGGLGHYFDIDPVVIRVLLVVGCLFGGAGLLAYAVLWTIVPEEGTDRASIRTSPGTRHAAIVVVAALTAVALLGNAWGGYDNGWPVGLGVALVLVAVLMRRREDRTRPGDPPTGISTPAPPGVAQPATRVPAAPAWTPPGVTSSMPQPTYARTPQPRRRGPVLFWPTLLLIGLGTAVLGAIDVSAVVPLAAYPALALGITGLMLVFGAFAGRAGGLAALGLVLAVLGGAASAGDALAGPFPASVQDTTLRPAAAAAVRDHYQFQTGQVRLDLTRLRDPRALDGREITITGRAGQIAVAVPRDVTVRVRSDVRYAGQIRVRQHRYEGLAPSADRTLRSAPQQPAITLHLAVRVGEIDVVHDLGTVGGTR